MEKEEKRKLVTRRTISDIQPIEGADRIEVATVDGWKVVVNKGRYYPGQLVFYFEIDSMIPLERSYFAFLESRGYKEIDGKKYHRLKTMKLRGQVSQGLIMPATIFNANWKAGWNSDLDYPTTEGVDKSISPYYDPDISCEKELEIMEKKGGDFSEYFGVFKYEPPVPACLRGTVKNWPQWITHTDEERVQNLDKETLAEVLKERKNFIPTEKIDGTSCTIYSRIYRGQYEKPYGDSGVCSRNWGLEEDDNNTYWKIAKTPLIKRYEGAELQTPLEYLSELCMEAARSTSPNETSYVLQGEIFGEGIQGNPLHIKGQQIRFFNLFEEGRQIMHEELQERFPELLPYWVPILDLELPDTIEKIIEQPDGIKSSVPGADPVQIEGIVWRHKLYSEIGDIRGSFKCISNKYLLKHDG